MLLQPSIKLNWLTFLILKTYFVGALLMALSSYVAEDEQFEADKAQVIKEIAAL